MFKAQAWRRGQPVTITAESKEDIERFFRELDRDIAGDGQTHPINHTEITEMKENVR